MNNYESFKDEFVVNRRSLTLHYDIINEERDSSKLGTITITVAFRPVACVKSKGLHLFILNFNVD